MLQWNLNIANLLACEQALCLGKKIATARPKACSQATNLYTCIMKSSVQQTIFFTLVIVK